MIIRRKHSSNYTVIPNALLQDDRLALDEKGLLCFLLHLPEDWVVRQGDLKKRCGVSKDKMQRLMRRLIELGYVLMVKSRDDDTQKFGANEYHVYDQPQATAGEPANCNEPQPENQATARTYANTGVLSENRPVSASPSGGRRRRATPLREPQPEKPWPENQAIYKRTSITKSSFGGADAPQEAQEEKGSGQASPSMPPSLNAQVWTAAKAILQPKEHGCVVRWLNQVKGRPNGLETLLSILRSAANAGTPQAVAYVTAAVNKEFPPPPDPREFPRSRWELAAQAVPRTKHWPEEWGPRPGEAGCLMPKDLITPDLVRAVSMRRVA